MKDQLVERMGGFFTPGDGAFPDPLELVFAMLDHITVRTSCSKIWLLSEIDLNNKTYLLAH